MSKYYAGIGARDTPKYVLQHMARVAAWLDRAGYTVRSGGASAAQMSHLNKVPQKRT